MLLGYMPVLSKLRFTTQGTPGIKCLHLQKKLFIGVTLLATVLLYPLVVRDTSNSVSGNSGIWTPGLDLATDCVYIYNL